MEKEEKKGELLINNLIGKRFLFLDHIDCIKKKKDCVKK